MMRCKIPDLTIKTTEGAGYVAYLGAGKVLNLQAPMKMDPDE
jgi:hypothetical protein